MCGNVLMSSIDLLNVQLVVEIEYFWMWFFPPLPNILYDALVLVSYVCAWLLTLV